MICISGSLRRRLKAYGLQVKTHFVLYSSGSYLLLRPSGIINVSRCLFRDGMSYYHDLIVLDAALHDPFFPPAPPDNGVESMI